MNDVRLQDAGFELSNIKVIHHICFSFIILYLEKKKSGMQQIHIDDK